MKSLMMTAVLALLACGCVSVNKNDGGDSWVKPGVVKDRVHLKYEVGKDRVQAVDQVNCLFGWICWGSTATHTTDQSEPGFGVNTKVKNGAYANACDAAQCDSIVGARYTLTTTDDYIVFKRVKAEISGYPAKVVGAEAVDAIKTPGPVDPTCKKGGILPF